MAKQTIALGAAVTGIGGDTIRGAFVKSIANFSELYLNMSDVNNPQSVAGFTGANFFDYFADPSNLSVLAISFPGDTYANFGVYGIGTGAGRLVGSYFLGVTKTDELRVGIVGNGDFRFLGITGASLMQWNQGNCSMLTDVASNVVFAATNFDFNQLSVGGVRHIPAIVTASAPATGATVSVGSTKADETLKIVPAGTLAALTISLPTIANSRTGQIVRGFITQIITALTVSVSGGGTVTGAAPVTSAVNSMFSYQCSSSAAGAWIRIS